MQAPAENPAELVGRADELAALSAFLERLEAAPAALLFEGEAGIGKTVLWAAGASLAREHGCRVLVSRAAEAEMQLPFVALGDLLATVPESVLEPLPEPQRCALDVAMLRADSQGQAIQRRAVSLAVLGALRGLAAEAPVLLALDDVQWLDAPSSAALQFALRRLDDERVGVLGTRRGRGGAVPLVEAFSRERLRRVEVAALDLESLGRLLLERLELPLARPALLQLYRVSGGNPFLALEIAAALRRHELTLKPGQPFPVPQNLRELVRDRLEDLVPPAREASLVVAALAQPTMARVEAALPADGLREAMRAGVLEIDGERVRFTHPLLGSIIYSEAPAERRRAVHARLAETAVDVEERAVHLAVSTTVPDAGVAALLDRAAVSALRRGAPETAADLYEHAVRVTPTEDAAARYRHTVDAAEARLRAGDGPAARDTFALAVDAAPDARARAHALTRLGAMLIRDWQPGRLAEALEAYARAANEAAGEPDLASAVERDLAWLGLFRGDRLGSVAHARRAVELAEVAADEERIALALATAAFFEGRGGNEEARDLLARAMRHERVLREHPFASRPHFVQALFLAGDGKLRDARALVDLEYRRALERGDEDSLPVLLEFLTIIDRRAGSWDDAERYAREMRETAERGRFSPDYHWGPYAWILALRGRTDDARTLAEAGAARADAGGIGPLFGGHRAVLGFVALSCGDVRTCADVLEPLSAALTPEIAETGWFRFLVDEVEARLALGELDRAHLLVDRLDERRGVLFDRAWARAAAEHCHGLVSAAAGDESGADAAFRRALREHERAGEPFERARTLLARGRVERRFKHRSASRESLSSARSLFERLGAPVWIERAEEELRRIGGRAPRTSGLTSTEERVAELVAQGLTNREVAATLFLSPNTVQAYLKRIYRELGVRSRTELARQSSSGGPQDLDS